MVAAVMPYATQCFITPMAAVAGAVAEEILAAMLSAAGLARAYVNDGGDIALHLSAGETFVVGMVERPDRPSLFGTTTLNASDTVRGVATSGWRGRMPSRCWRRAPPLPMLRPRSLLMPSICRGILRLCAFRPANWRQTAIWERGLLHRT
jgi:hypothetical protein